MLPIFGTSQHYILHVWDYAAYCCYAIVSVHTQEAKIVCTWHCLVMFFNDVRIVYFIYSYLDYWCWKKLSGGWSSKVLNALGAADILNINTGSRVKLCNTLQRHHSLDLSICPNNSRPILVCYWNVSEVVFVCCISLPLIVVHSQFGRSPTTSRPPYHKSWYIWQGNQFRATVAVL